MKISSLSTILILFAMSAFTNSIHAQGAYVDFKAGYALGLSTSNLEWFDFNNGTSGTNSITQEQVNVSLGKGLNFGGTFGYMFNKNIGAELGVSYLLGSKTKAQDDYPGGKTEYSLSAKMLRINPALVISSGLEGLSPYAKFGVIIGAGSILYESNDNDDGDIEIFKFKMKEGLAFGLSSSIGILSQVNDNLSYFAELQMTSLSYAPKKGEFTEYSINGTDVLPDLTTSEKEIEFVDSYTYNFNNPPPDSQPSKELKQKMPFSGIGINIGVRIGF